MSDAPPADERTFLGHPVALFLLFTVELWERFSFYGMRALLVLFMTKEFLWGDDQAYGVYAAYGSLVYATPILGGFFADRVLGYRNAITLGGVLMALGHFTLGTEPFFEDGETVFYAALALLIIGNGFFKPNISSLVGKLYPEGDPRRDGAFTIFYMGINVGAMIAPLVCGYLGEVWGWHYGFGAAGVGMALGLFIFLGAQRMLGDEGLPPGQTPDTRNVFTPGILGTWVAAFLAVPAVMAVIRVNEFLGPAAVSLLGDDPLFFGLIATDDVLFLGLLALFLVVLSQLLWMAFSAEAVQRDQLLVVIFLLPMSTTFWAFFELAGSAINLFTDRNVDRMIFGWEMPTSFGQAINPFFIILLAPIIAQVWQRLALRDRDPTPGVKFGLGLLQLGLGFVVLWSSQFFGDAAGKVPLMFLLFGYLLHTTGELFLSPVGLSMVTKLSPPKAVGFVMGAWFLATAFSHIVAGVIARLTGAGGGHGGGEEVVEGSAETLAIYTDVFGSVGMFACLAGVLCLAMSPVLAKWMHGVK